jgi:hypothetical protein
MFLPSDPSPFVALLVAVLAFDFLPSSQAASTTPLVSILSYTLPFATQEPFRFRVFSPFACPFQAVFKPFLAFCLID